MTERQKKILEMVIKEYVQYAEPISSGKICGQSGLDCSSATIRNDLSFLEKEGYLEQLHTSGGRIPTDKAYRYIVNQIMGDQLLSLEEQKKIQQEYLKLKAEYKRLAKLSSRLLAKFAQGVAVGGDVQETEAYETGISKLLKEPEYENVSRVAEVVDLLEYFDEHLDEVYDKIEGDKANVFIGEENVFKSVKDHSIIVSGYKLGNGEKGLLALIGPKRMNYQKNLALVKGIVESISRNFLPVVIFMEASLLIISF